MDIKHLPMILSHPKIIATFPSVKILFVHTVGKSLFALFSHFWNFNGYFTNYLNKTRHVCTYLNAFFTVFSNLITKVHNFDFLYTVCYMFDLSSAALKWSLDKCLTLQHTGWVDAIAISKPYLYSCMVWSFTILQILQKLNLVGRVDYLLIMNKIVCKIKKIKRKYTLWKSCTFKSITFNFYEYCTIGMFVKSSVR